MANVFLGMPKVQYFDSNGDPLAGGLLYTYEVGTTTNKASYPTLADADAQTNANANPVVLDSRGEADVVLVGATKLVLKNSDATTTYWTLDNVNSSAVDIIDSNGNYLLKTAPVASAVNYWTLNNAATGGSPFLYVEGTDANINAVYQTKGTGIHKWLDGSGNEAFTTTDSGVSNATNNLSALNGTGDVSLLAEGGSTNIGIIINPKGTSPVTHLHSDTRTNTVSTTSIIQSNTSGTAAAGIGTAQSFVAEDDAGNSETMGAIGMILTDATSGSEDSAAIINLITAGSAVYEGYRFTHTGTASAKVTFTGALTADRTVTIPDADVEIPQAATQAEMEAGAVTDAYSSPLRHLFHPSSAKAWAAVDGTGTANLIVSYNVASMVDNGTGDYTMTIATDFSTANYCVTAGIDTTGTLLTSARVTNRAAGSFDLKTVTATAAGDTTTTALDVDYVSFSAFGDI